MALSTTPGLFIDTDATRATAFEPQIARSRFVKVDLGLLIDETGRSRNVKEIRLNLFPDVVHQGVIVRTESNGDGYSWVGYLEGAENSSLTMISTGGAFIGRFTSPLEAYEVSGAGDGLYLIVEINQSHYPGGDENGTHEAH